MSGFRLHRRFDRMGRLVGDRGMEKLLNSHVLVVGLGGVGSFAAEALVRSGVGKLSIVDFDLVCITNSNRQIQAIKGVVGKPKANVLAERLRLINPKAQIKAIPLIYDERTSGMLLEGKNAPDFVVDAIDNVSTKCHLLARCRELNIPIVCSTGASGRWDPTAIEIADLAKTKVDPLAHAVRKILRQKHGFPRKGPFNISAVFSTEPLQQPEVLQYDRDGEFQCVCPSGEIDFHGCDTRNVIWGTAGFVTGAFGLACASIVVKGLSQERSESLKEAEA
ncbi:MAG: tRNA threonylcarbamoyladenosine dehydratase [Proteobacteria bacterium]|nr:tRNA threonylcarbamoyladenosine dehydratase [Pseudomonadota bacterium]